MRGLLSSNADGDTDDDEYEEEAKQGLRHATSPRKRQCNRTPGVYYSACFLRSMTISLFCHLNVTLVRLMAVIVAPRTTVPTW